MKDEIWTRAEIESPCVKICVIHPEAKICIGCWRSLQEIAQWSSLSAEARHDLMTELPLRAARLQKRRGGRAARQAATE